MFLIPLNQIESVELVVHALRIAGGEADCTSCPARKVCMKQCLSIAEAIDKMVREGTLPGLDFDPGDDPENPPENDPSPGGDGPQLKVVK